MRVLFVLALALSGCWIFPGNDCTPFAQRCNGTLVQTCNTDRRWFQTNDCAVVEPTSMNWTCCTNAEGRSACLPASDSCRRQASRPALRLPTETVAKHRVAPVQEEGWF